MQQIELNVHVTRSGHPKLIRIGTDATVELLVKELQAAGAAVGESGDEIDLWVENKKIKCHRQHKIHECGIRHGHHIHMCNEVEVAVSYTGHDNYEHRFPQSVEIGEVKRHALHKFELEPSAADQYVLQHSGVNLDDHLKIGSLEKCEVALVLARKKPQEKGHAG